jgi:uncharacterized membrane protein (UPF0127 family)
MAEFKFNHKEKNFNIDVQKCDTVISRMFGLMMKGNSKPLLFIFPEVTNEPIHSFFCIPFIAIWFDQDKVVDVKMVRSWNPYVRPCAKFDKLLEIPSSYSNFNEFIKILN